jgi:hypothetical protein
LNINQRVGLSNSKKLKEIESNGKSIAQNSAIKASKTMRNIQENGLSIQENGVAKMVEKRKEIQESGLSINQEVGIKTSRALLEKYKNGYINPISKKCSCDNKIFNSIKDACDFYKNILSRNSLIKKFKDDEEVNFFYL